MNAFKKRLCLLVICSAFASSFFAVAQTVPDTRDRDVLEALMQHLLSDPRFDMTGASSNGVVIVLNTRTPEGSRFCSLNQLRANIGDRSIPYDAERNLLGRNADPAFYSNLGFSAGIKVADLDQIVTRNGDEILVQDARRNPRLFETSYPKARAWVEAYLPGYSTDGAEAVAYAGVGPSSNGAAITALLAKRGSKWRVEWYQVTWFL